MAKKLQHIELFAGCGGMTLGLEGAGFELYLANELSPMAGETFAYNLLGEDLSALADKGKVSKKVLWIKSKYFRDNLKHRLRENPFEFGKGKFHEDLGDNTELKGKLILGNIDHFIKYLNNNEKIKEKLRKENIDVLSGGPPCQGFSLAGRRIKDDYKNQLPLSFANFAGLTKPKIVILENVKGITSAFKDNNGKKHYAWLEIAKAFSLRGFVPLCMVINSKYFGIPQNRPRFIMLAFRRDIFNAIVSRDNNSMIVKDIAKNSFDFFKKVNSTSRLDKISINDIKLYDLENASAAFNGELLPKVQTTSKNLVSAINAIDDLRLSNENFRINKTGNKYSKELSKLFKPKYKKLQIIIQNHEPRKHSKLVQARFLLYQIFNKFNDIKQIGIQVISGKIKDDEVIEKIFNSIRNEDLLDVASSGHGFIKLKNVMQFKEYLKLIETKKHSQRAIKCNEPAPAQLTIPDDLCHYSSNELRTLTVREMARFQSFPDWFIFKSKITTGGNQRTFEVPQYTQVGNAVPPLLALEIGKTISKILDLHKT